jgi:BirA family biotin operon repressor/biotin-[acetyl-CoA-carboxylase] ligase
MTKSVVDSSEYIDKSIIYEYLKEFSDVYNIELSIKEIVETTSREFNAQDVEGSDVKISLAEYQTHGRGRGNQVWQSPFASGICLSVFSKLNVRSIPLGLSVYMGVMLINSLEKMSFENIKLKWPNDLFYDGCKLGGILVELSQNRNGDLIANFGLGINYSLPDNFYKSIDSNYNPIDLKTINNNNEFSRNEIIGILVCEIIKSIKGFDTKSIEEIKERWRELDYLYSQEIKINSGDDSIIGVNKGIDSEGALLIKQGRNLKRIISGQIEL